MQEKFLHFHMEGFKNGRMLEVKTVLKVRFY